MLAHLKSKSFLIISMQPCENVYFDRFWNPLLRDQRTSAYKELASQVKKNRNNQLQLPAGKLSLFQMEHELGLLLRNKTIEPRLRVQVYTIIIKSSIFKYSLLSLNPPSGSRFFTDQRSSWGKSLVASRGNSSGQQPAS